MIGRVLGAWVHDLDPVAIHFPASWGLRGVHWYGLAYAAGFLAAAWLLGRWRRQGLAPARQAADESTLVTAAMIGVLAGGRLGHVLLYARDEFAAVTWPASGTRVPEASRSSPSATCSAPSRPPASSSAGSPIS
jgi:prolipoprotein diacylglyceryltransferase